MTELSSRPVRINELLQQYWHELRGDRPLPLESEINAQALGEIWPSCYLISVRAHGFAYDYLGPDLVTAYGDDFTGHEIAETLVYPHPPSLFSTFQNVCKTMQPALDDSEFTNSRGMRVKYRSCVLPLGGNSRTGVAFLLGGMKWKAYEAAQEH